MQMDNYFNQPVQPIAMEPIRSLSAAELVSWTAGDDPPRIVEFFASWCIYHLLTKRKLEQLQLALGGIIAAGSIDCTGNEERFLSLGINQIPAIGYFSDTVKLIWFGDTEVEFMLADIQKAYQEKANQENYRS